MLKVNLEKELIRQNKKVLLPQELLALNEYERLGDDICESEILSRIGMNRAAATGKLFKEHNTVVGQRLAAYDQTRVFHISQIKSLCKKYHLRFLDVTYYTGSVDKSLAAKLSTFEVAYGKRIEDYKCKIAAPIKSFKLEERPKDPLFFYNLGDDYWCLIHKWGNDLTVFRRLYRLFSSAWVAWLSIAIPLFWIAAKGFTVNSEKELSLSLAGGVCLLAAVGYTVWCIASGVNDEQVRFVKKNKWDSQYL